MAAGCCQRPPFRCAGLPEPRPSPGRSASRTPRSARGRRLAAQAIGAATPPAGRLYERLFLGTGRPPQRDCLHGRMFSRGLQGGHTELPRVCSRGWSADPDPWTYDWTRSMVTSNAWLVSPRTLCAWISPSARHAQERTAARSTDRCSATTPRRSTRSSPPTALGGVTCERNRQKRTPISPEPSLGSTAVSVVSDATPNVRAFRVWCEMATSLARRISVTGKPYGHFQTMCGRGTRASSAIRAAMGVPAFLARSIARLGAGTKGSSGGDQRRELQADQLPDRNRAGNLE